MATFRKRNGKWNVQIRKKSSQGSISGTFLTKSEARLWAATVEAELEHGRSQFNGASPSDARFSELLDRYAREIVPQHKGWKSELSILKLVRRRLGRFSLAELQAKDLAEFRDRRLSEVGPQTTKHALSVANRVLVQATQEWGYVLPLGVPKVKNPKLPPGRVRRLESGEERRLLEALSETPRVQSVVRFALETAMRRGEIINLLWGHVDCQKRIAWIPRTKTGIPRTVPLSREAINVLEHLPRSSNQRVFDLRPQGITQAFARARDRCGIAGLRFHDLRHEATSRLFEKGLDVMEVAAITGHRSTEMLCRYTHLRAENLLEKLD